MEDVVFGCCLGVGEEDGGSDLHWTDRRQPIKIIIPFDEAWCCVSDRAGNKPSRSFTVSSFVKVLVDTFNKQGEGPTRGHHRAL